MSNGSLPFIMGSANPLYDDVAKLSATASRSAQTQTLTLSATAFRSTQTQTIALSATASRSTQTQTIVPAPGEASALSTEMRNLPLKTAVSLNELYDPMPPAKAEALDLPATTASAGSLDIVQHISLSRDIDSMLPSSGLPGAPQVFTVSPRLSAAQGPPQALRMPDMGSHCLFANDTSSPVASPGTDDEKARGRQTPDNRTYHSGSWASAQSDVATFSGRSFLSLLSLSDSDRSLSTSTSGSSSSRSTLPNLHHPA